MTSTILFEIISIQILLYLLYWLLLSRDTFFSLQRNYLLTALIFSHCIPFLSFPIFGDGPLLYSTQLDTFNLLSSGLSEQYESIKTSSSSFIGLSLLLIYMTGLSWKSRGLWQSWIWIRNLEKGAQVQYFEGVKVLYTQLDHPPFSTLGKIYLPKYRKGQSDEHLMILRHEQSHVQLNHSMDLCLLEILSCLFWFNPILLFYRRSLITIHEYQADEAVLIHTDIQLYGQKLIEQSICAKELPGVHYFFTSQIKNRIKMMTKKRSNDSSKWKYIAVIPAFFALFFTIACEKEAVMDPTEEIVIEIEGEEIISQVDTQASLIKCESEESKDVAACTMSELMQFLGSNLKYPTSAQDAGLEGKVMASFVISSTGTMKDIAIKKSLSKDCDEEVIRVLQELAKSQKWQAAEKDGQPVATELILPVAFKLGQVF
jgi:TonB family protein